MSGMPGRLVAALVAAAALGGPASSRCANAATPHAATPPAAATATKGDADPALRAAEKEIRHAVDVLAADDMEGRGLGTGGIRRAADWIEKRLRAIGLEPAFAGSYRQPFLVKTGVRLVPGNRLDGVADSDWTPLGFSSAGEFAGDLVFAGYGIDAPEIGYRELEGLDLAGKVVLMLRYEPQEKDDASPFDGRRPSRFSAQRRKVLLARERGAAAVVFVTGPLQDEGNDRIPALRNDGPESPAGLPVVQVKTSVAAAWLARAGLDLERFQRDVDRDLAPRSAAVAGVRVAGRVALEAINTGTENVAGVLPGRGGLAGEAIVLGAHYDHLGMGGEGSMRPNEHAVHNGADDNASGVATVLAIADALQQRLADAPQHRSVYVALFSAEEVGLAGSAEFVRAPPAPIERIVAMINLDMVGRLRDDTLIAFGSETAPEWTDAIARAAAAAPGLKVNGRGDGYGPSDQTAFYAAMVPVLHLFTGTHEQYHTPEDDAATVDAHGAARIARFGTALASDLAGQPARLTYARSTSGPVLAGDSRGYGAYLGTVPDYRAMEASAGGVLLADVRTGGPADRAGIRGGDRIVEMAGTRIENLYDMTFALQDHKPEDTIDVVVVRGGERLTLRATLGDRAKIGQEPGAAAHAAPAPTPATPPASPPAPVSPPAQPAPAQPAPAPASAAPSEPVATGAPSWYADRPGPGLSVGAGRPFERTFEGEGHLEAIRQLTFGGENAEAYFSPDGRRLIFQATPPDAGCDREFILDLASGDLRPASSGRGRTTCGYYDWPEADRIIYASTEGGSDTCPPPPDYSQGYVWALYDAYDIYEQRLGPDGWPDATPPRRIIASPGYDAEATWCHRGGRLVFTSTRDGDLDLYTADETGEVKRLTTEEGYDGGAFFSPDCREIVWRASRPQGVELEEYRALLKKGLIRPKSLEIYAMKADGTDRRQLTANGAANFCPYFTPDGARVIYASNAGSQGGREFDLYIVSARGGGTPERVTTAPGFDGFPMFSPDGRWLVWASNRANPAGHETNLFIARWKD
jgi:TolB protein